MKILMIFDDEAIAQEYVTHLREDGHEVQIVIGREEGLKVLFTFPPELLIIETANKIETDRLSFVIEQLEKSTPIVIYIEKIYQPNDGWVSHASNMPTHPSQWRLHRPVDMEELRLVIKTLTK